MSARPLHRCVLLGFGRDPIDTLQPVLHPARGNGESASIVVGVSGPRTSGRAPRSAAEPQGGLAGRRAGRTPTTPWARAREAGLADWWFSAAQIAEKVDMLACSYLARSVAGPHDGAVRLVDRGIRMLEASVGATVAVRERQDHRSATERAGELLEPYQRDLDRGGGRGARCPVGARRRPTAGPPVPWPVRRGFSLRYAAYQSMLGMHLQAPGGRGTVRREDHGRRPLHPVGAARGGGPAPQVRAAVARREPGAGPGRGAGRPVGEREERRRPLLAGPR